MGGATVIQIPRKMHVSDCHPLASSLHISIDEQGIRSVVAYDMDAGWIEKARFDEDGEFVTDGDQWVMERVYGKVMVTV